MPVSNERLGRLCANLDHDATLREVLRDGGVAPEQWAVLTTAVGTGSGEDTELGAVLDHIDAVAGELGLEHVTRGAREMPVLPSDLPGFRTLDGWRCPNQRRCDRVEFLGTASEAAPACGITGARLAPVRVVSG